MKPNYSEEEIEKLKQLKSQLSKKSIKELIADTGRSRAWINKVLNGEEPDHYGIIESAIEKRDKAQEKQQNVFAKI